MKNHGPNFAIPYFHDGQNSEYLPDCVIRLNGAEERYLIAELKGADWKDTAEAKALAAAPMARGGECDRRVRFLGNTSSRSVCRRSFNT